MTTISAPAKLITTHAPLPVLALVADWEVARELCEHLFSDYRTCSRYYLDRQGYLGACLLTISEQDDGRFAITWPRHVVLWEQLCLYRRSIIRWARERNYL